MNPAILIKAKMKLKKGLTKVESQETSLVANIVTSNESQAKQVIREVLRKAGTVSG